MVIQKGGDAAVFNQAKPQQAYWGGCNQFQASVGQMTGDAVGTCSTDDNGKALISNSS